MKRHTLCCVRAGILLGFPGSSEGSGRAGARPSRCVPRFWPPPLFSMASARWREQSASRRCQRSNQLTNYSPQHYSKNPDNHGNHFLPPCLGDGTNDRLVRQERDEIIGYWQKFLPFLKSRIPCRVVHITRTTFKRTRLIGNANGFPPFRRNLLPESSIVNLGVSIIHKLLIDRTRLFENQLEPIERRPFQMSCRTPYIFFRQLSYVAVYMAEQMIKTGCRFCVQFLRRCPRIYEPVIQRRINVRVELLEVRKCLWLMRHHHAYPPSSQRNFVHIDIWSARSNLRSTSSCGIQS